MTYNPVIAGLLALVAGSLSGCNALISRVGANASEAWVSRVYSAAEAKSGVTSYGKTSVISSNACGRSDTSC